MSAKALLSIINKNLGILLRSKFSTAAIILVPFLVILFAGYAFDSSGLTGINIGVYSNSYSSLTEEIFQDFEDQNFVVKKFDFEEECITAVKSSKVQICGVFPQDLSERGSAEEVKFYVDSSRMNLAYTLVHSIESKIYSKSSSLGMDLADQLVRALENAKNSLPTQREKIISSQDKLNEINSLSDSDLSLEEIEDALVYLEFAKNLVNGSALTKITDTIMILENLKNSNSEASENLDEIGTSSLEAKSLLAEVSLNLDLLI